MKPVSSIPEANSPPRANWSLKSKVKPGGATGKITRKPRGFALVVTLSLMILLTVIAVGLLSLSAVSLRTSSQGMAHAEARANARLALMLAIGELQKSMGPDQRVSASGAIVAEADVRHPHWTGAWDSWKAGPTASGSDATSEHSTIAGTTNIGMAPTYEAQRADHFRSWLVSLDPIKAKDALTPSTLTLDGVTTPGTGSAVDAVRLVGAGSLGSGDDQKKDYVSAGLLALKSKASATTLTGRYGWWVGDESQKARIMEDSYNSTPPATNAEKIFRAQAPGSTGTTTVKGLENLKDDKQLNGLPSLQTLNLVAGVTDKPSENFHSVTPYSRQVLADVREGGLKRDLSTLLERPIVDSEKGNEHMLYKFSTKDTWMSGNDYQECVPIQDIAAYYQLYDGNQTNQSGINHSTWKKGVKYDSNLLAKGIQLISPDYGGKAPNDPAYYREYTNIYRQPVPIKIQFLLSMFSQPINPAPTDPAADTHELLLGVTPAVTLWNPTNVPLVMNFDGSNPQLKAVMTRLGSLPIRIQFNKNNTQPKVTNAQHLPWYRGTFDGNKPDLFNLYFSGVRAIRFAPGEVKCFSLPHSGDLSGKKNAVGFSNSGAAGQAANKLNFWFKTDKYFEPHEVVGGWESESFMLFNNSASGGAPHVVNNRLRFKATDSISFEITSDNTTLGTGDTTNGGAMSFVWIQTNHQDAAGGGTWGRRHYVFNSRFGTGASHWAFNQSLFTKGFPQEKTLITASSRTGANIISRSSSNAGWPFMQFSLQAGGETNEAANGGLAGGGRKFASRPFLHSSPLTAPFIDDFTGNSLYNAGWNWSVDEINDVFEAPVEISGDDQGYYGGGYTKLTGTTHVVQQEIPAVPPISIAALSHARLGGFSIANDEAGGYANQNITAVGQAGLFPHTLQAIGNSYGHPNLAANKAYDSTVQRVFHTTDGGRGVTFADHSYLANKALWDEFFFSSITPQPSTVKVFGNTTRSAKTVADEFFFSETPLPNRRMAAYTTGLDKTKLDTMFTAAQQQQFTDGLADRIAALLMVEGPFNINSTSVEAWKIFLSSLKGKSVTYLDKDTALTGADPVDAKVDGTPVGSFTLPSGKPTRGTSDPKDPDQWTSWRELRDTEIEELATAVVKQVKLRGPFLSLSEFVNRRLDASKPDLAAKGALQAALDDSSVSINAGFRNSVREFSSKEISAMNPTFPEALKGPVAYGSSAYIDQADVLRNFSEQLTPRGDTFVIRTYGDSVDPQGKVVARAWCEAVVQRIPEYFDPVDESHVKQADLKSVTNRTFGRKFQLVSFRWLTDLEV